jgi:hypothetical protein
MAAVKAYIAAPLGPPRKWALLRSPSELPPGYGIFGSIQIGALERPALEVDSESLPRIQSAHTALPLLEPEHLKLCPHCPLRHTPMRYQELPP